MVGNFRYEEPLFRPPSEAQSLIIQGSPERPGIDKTRFPWNILN